MGEAKQAEVKAGEAQSTAQQAVAQQAPPAPAQSNSFNPEISLILQGSYNNLSQNPNIYQITGFIPTKNYGPHTSPYDGEIGTVEQVRYLCTTVCIPFSDAGGAKGTMRSTTGTLADVYPILYIARDAYGIVPLKGKSSLTPMVVNPKPAPGDPLAQRGTVGWKAYQAAVILNDAWMARAEVAATA